MARRLGVVEAGARARVRLAPLVIASVFALALISAVAVGQVRSPSSTLIGVEEITPGMRGYGLTVFRGTRPERFDVEVIDVLHNFRPDQDLILVRTHHPILEHAQVVGGMSGSPVYFDGRLAGAYAYGWPFSRDPIAGITPIRNMLAEMRRPILPRLFPGMQPIPGAQSAPRTGARGARTSGLGGLPPYLGEHPATATTALHAHAARLGLDPARPRGDGTTLERVSTPVFVGGLSEAVSAQLGAQLEGFGLTVLQAGGAGPATPPAGTPTAYEHGSAVGVQLVRGDIAATAVGTVTHLEGDRVAAFGHPMINAGQTGLPTAIARVLHILASQSRSFKISEPVRPLGALVHDRQSAIVVDTGVAAAGVEAVVRVHGADGAPRTEWRFTVASHRVFTPLLMASAIQNAVEATASDNTDVTFDATSRLTIAGRSAPIEVVDFGYSRTGANALALQQLRLFSLLEATYGNPFEEGRATHIEVDLRLRYARDTMRIVDASVAGREVDPGSMVPVRVVLRRFDQSEEVRTIEVPIADHLAGQTLELRIEPGSEVSMEHVQPRDLDEILAAIQQRYSTTSMIISVRSPQRGLRFPGHVASHLPASALDALQLTNDGDRVRPFVTYDRRETPMGAVLHGGAVLELTVRRTRRP